MKIKLIGTLSFLMVMACKSGGRGSDEAAFDDASEFSLGDDGKYTVICKNGDEETHDRATLKRGIIDPSDQTICKNDGGDPNAAKVLCVAMKRDDRDPFFLAIVQPLKDPKPWEAAGKYWKKEECQRIADAIAYDESGICLSKVRDNMRPFIKHVITDKNLFVPATGGTFAKFDDCDKFYNDLKQVAGKTIGCWFKDFDGRRPYAIFSVDENYNITREGATIFPSMDSCKESIDFEE